MYVFYDEPEFHVKDSIPNLVFLVSEGGVLQPPLWSRILIKLSHLLLSLSSAANIVIYSAKVSLTSPAGNYADWHRVITWSTVYSRFIGLWY